MRLRLFLDAGAGVCLWSQDDEAKARFGYPVEASALDIPLELRHEIDQLVRDHDAAFPWDDPGGAAFFAPERVAFGYEDAPPFQSRVRALLPKLRAALPGFEIESDFEA